MKLIFFNMRLCGVSSVLICVEFIFYGIVIIFFSFMLCWSCPAHPVVLLATSSTSINSKLFVNKAEFCQVCLELKALQPFFVFSRVYNYSECSGLSQNKIEKLYGFCRRFCVHSNHAKKVLSLTS